MQRLLHTGIAALALLAASAFAAALATALSLLDGRRGPPPSGSELR